jgi:hypothetical protein
MPGFIAALTELIGSAVGRGMGALG